MQDKNIIDWRIAYKTKHGKKLYHIIGTGKNGIDAFNDLEKTFPGITDHMIYIDAENNNDYWNKVKNEAVK